MAEGQVEDTNNADYAKMLEQKITEANLSSILDGFVSLEMTTDDLLICDESDIQSIIEEANMDVSSQQIAQFTQIVIDIQTNQQQQDANPEDMKSHLKKLVQLGSVGANALKILAKIEKFDVDTSKTVDKDQYIKQIDTQYKEQKALLNTQYLSAKKEMERLKQAAIDKIEFYRDLYTQYVQNFSAPDPAKSQRILLEEWTECISNTTHGIGSKHTQQRLDSLEQKVETTKKEINAAQAPQRKEFKMYFKHDKNIWIIGNSGRSVSVKLDPVSSFKCNVEGNVVSLQWDEYDPNNYILNKMREFGDYHTNYMSAKIQYSQSNDEQKTPDADIQWIDVNVHNYCTSCQLYLNNNCAYRFRMQYQYENIGVSRFSEIINVSTTDERPLESNLSKYAAVWSNVYRSKHVELKQNNTVAVSTKGGQSVRCELEIQTGHVVMWELNMRNQFPLHHSIFGVVIGENETFPMDEFASELYECTIPNLYGISSRAECNNNYFKSSHSWNIDNIKQDKDATNNIKIIADYTGEECTLKYIINHFIYGTSVKVDMKNLKEGHIYPCCTFYSDSEYCEIRAVSG
eukprot:71934_1